ncbi:hypothetical protein [Streptomyces sp. SR-10]|uniref:hypothetical protein n=1 Tax=Streptomyces sp. SR-10 TaxID=3416442 RepID=UPI003CE8E29A
MPDSTTGMTSSSFTGPFNAWLHMVIEPVFLGSEPAGPVGAPARVGQLSPGREEVTRAVRRGDIRGVELAAADGCRDRP